MVMPPILDNKHTASLSVFVPSTLLREARRQKGLAKADVPPVCILDPDGDLVRRLRRLGATKPFEGWPCYHTELDTFSLGSHRVEHCGTSGGRFLRRTRSGGNVGRRLSLLDEPDVGGEIV